MRQNRHSAKCATRGALCCGAILILVLGHGQALASSSGTAPSGQSRFQELRDKYYTDRSIEFARELLLKEEYLSALYHCTVAELKARRKEGLDLKALWSPIWQLTPAQLNREDSTYLAADLARRYKLWKDFEEREFQRRLELIMQVRSQLISGGTAAQKERMFKRELKSALHDYGVADWELARLLFDRLLTDYGYHNVDDILYYQGQTCLQLRLFDGALEYFDRLLSTCPTSSFRSQSYDQASAILQALGSGAEIRKLYSDYLQEGSPGNPAKMGGVHLRAAHAEADLGHYQVAVEILERVDKKSSHYLASRYLLGDCLAALEDWSRAAEVFTAMLKAKPHNLPSGHWRLLKDEARVKLAYIYYKWGDYHKAAELFSEVRGYSPFYDRALMGKAWIAYQLDQYPDAIAKTEQLLDLYPRSIESYEASSLAGYCYEQMGDKNAAISHFLEVLQAGVGRSQLQSFLEERRRIGGAMAELRALEDKVFSGGDEGLFSEYKRSRDQLWICQQRVGLAELLEVNTRLRALVEERRALDSLLVVHTQMESVISQKKNAELIADFLKLEDRIYTAMEDLKAAGKKQLRTSPLYYQEAQIGYVNMRADSLSRNLDQEIEKLTASIKGTEGLKGAALNSGNVAKGLDLGKKADDLSGALDRTYSSQTQAASSRRSVLMTRVDRWSDFSFNRYAMGGMDLEELDRKYERLKQVEEYLATIDELLEQRHKDNTAEDTSGKP